MPADDSRKHYLMSLRGRIAVVLFVGLLLLCSNLVFVPRFQFKVTVSSTSSRVAIIVPTDPSTMLQRMIAAGSPLQRSVLQQASYLAKKGNLTHIFPESRLFSLVLDRWAANRVTEDYAYLHIFKNGGTTIMKQTSRGHDPINRLEVQERKWFALVRDPIDHFLSGWAEAGNAQRRQALKRMGLDPDMPFDGNGNVPVTLKAPYNSRIRQWLRIVTEVVHTNRWHPGTHSAPQVNFMLDPHGKIWDQLEILGDLQELPAMMTFIGFPFNASKEPGRNASANLFLQTYFPRRVDLLSNQTLRMLCNFLAIDYYLLAFALPEACQDMPTTGYDATYW
jgi:hypothetical protein